ncbi:alpha-hydroxy-acid oxidizing protein [Myxococcota bacterium]|nr:alpha-hydroxy-acid oxidizing protein [Myxococcota bacterium]MBU1380831.1 alpha-hydroxy-acid oxidizing protein [Myxococcota bacterium]MBU1499191.1 alpha-hydroxy-acid oxidizing protein [Myxococcota bacterium]
MKSDSIGERKNRHFFYFTNHDYPDTNLFDCIKLFNNPLCDIDLDNVDTSLNFLTYSLSFPLMIASITGGTSEVGSFNEDISQAASDFRLPLSCGSIRIALENPNLTSAFKLKKSGIPFYAANIGAATLSSIDLSALDSFLHDIEADILFIHFNRLQELAQAGGDRCFDKTLTTLKTASEKLHTPIILKETGWGFGPQSWLRALELGACALDTGGSGGTDFLSIELDYNSDLIETMAPFSNWGVPTPACLLMNKNKSLPLIAGGGIRNGLDVFKSLVIGASLASIAGTAVKAWIDGGLAGLLNHITEIINQFRMAMVLTGSNSVSDICNLPFSIGEPLSGFLNVTNQN